MHPLTGSGWGATLSFMESGVHLQHCGSRIRALLLLALVVFLSGGTTACGKKERHRSVSPLEKGRHALAAGRPGEALVHLERAIKAHPERLGPRRLQARALMRLGRLAEARDVLERALRISKKGAAERYPLLLDLAEVMTRQGRYGRAAELYGLAIEEDPGQVIGYWRLGKLYESNHQWKDARRAYARLLDRHPGPAVAAEAYLKKARCSLKAGRLEEARKDAEAGLSVGKAAAKVEAGLEGTLADVALVEKDWAAAVRHLRRALDLDDRDALAWSNLGTALAHARGCTKDALAALRRASSRHAPLSVKGLSCLAESSNPADHLLARQEAFRALREGRLDRKGKVILAGLLLEAGQGDRALDVISELAAVRGRLGTAALLVQAKALAALGRHAESFALYSRLVARGSRDPAVLRGQAVEAAWSGRYGAALNLLRPLVEKTPGDPELATAFAVALGGLGRVAQARAMLNKVLTKARAARDQTAEERAVVYLAWLDLRSGRYRAALDATKAMATRKGPFQVHALDIRIQALVGLGKKKAARRLVRQALGSNLSEGRRRYFEMLLERLGRDKAGMEIKDPAVQPGSARDHSSPARKE